MLYIFEWNNFSEILFSDLSERVLFFLKPANVSLHYGTASKRLNERCFLQFSSNFRQKLTKKKSGFEIMLWVFCGIIISLQQFSRHINQFYRYFI